MDIVGVFEAKAHLSMLLERVSQGEKITISNRGVPVAILSPVPSPTSQTRKTAIANIRAFRKKHSLGKHSAKSLIEEGRKY